ncbi:MAG: hypothetical protein Q8876_03255 [Bacillota bacterium]|nr:hypothetical protein [Bacillota bacterium]
MYCENLFCIYFENEKCTLDEISLNIQGLCQECIYVSIYKEILNEERQKILNSYKE